MKKYLFLILVVLGALGCSSKLPDVPEVKNPVEKSNTSTIPAAAPVKVEASKLANKSIVEIDQVFGTPDEAKDVENGGKYRLYKSPAFPKGLAIRFYNGQAKSFNLILEKPVPDSKQAILQNLGIDVGRATPAKNPKEPLSESYQGNFGGINFTKVSAKKQENGSGFIFVLAEVGR